jgi:hypothetical protein
MEGVDLGPVDAAPATRRSYAGWVHLATLIIAGVALLWWYRNQWFFGDEWSPILQRQLLGPAEKSLLDPHNEHWSTVAMVVYRVHLAIFGLTTYFPLAVLAVAVHLATAHALWRTCLRVGANAWVATGLVALFLLYGPARDDLLFAWNFTFTGAIGLGLLILLVMPLTGPFSRRDAVACWGVGTFMLLMSGVALTMLFAIAIHALMARGWRVALKCMAVPALVYIGWTIGWGSTGYQGVEPPSGYLGAARFVGEGLTNAFDLLAGIEYTGVVVLSVLALCVLLDSALRRSPGSIALALAMSGVGWYLAVALRRSGGLALGPDTGRYLLAAFALFVPILALELTRLWSRNVLVRVVAVSSLLALVVHQIGVIDETESRVAALKQRERSRIVAAAALLRSGVPLVGHSVLGSSVFEDALTVDRLRSLAEDGKLPSVDAIAPEDELAAIADLMVDVTPGEAPVDSPPARIIGVRDAALVQQPTSRCSTVVPSGPRPTVILRAPTVPAFLEIEIAELTVFQLRVVRDGFVGHPRDITLLGAGRYQIEIGIANSTVQLSTYQARFIICDPAR